MKKLLLTLFLLVNCTWLMAQFSENFDGLPVKLTASGPGTWTIDNTYSVSAPNSFRGEYGINGYTTATTDPFSTFGNSFVILSFKHICKIDFADTAKVEVSINGGLTWAKLFDDGAGNNNCIYQGASPSFKSVGSKFAESAYSVWAPGQPTTPLNTWWQTETFDISNLTGNQPDVRIRFTAIDNNGNAMLTGRYGWLIDDISVTVATCEQNPPTFYTPTPTNPKGTIYNLSTIDVYDSIVDPSGIAFADLYWTINGVGPQNYGGMFDLGNGFFVGTLSNFGGNFSDGDTVCWWIEATDASCNSNIGTFPSGGSSNCQQFIVSSGIHFPFCDDFDNANNLWTPDTRSIGTQWEYGAPAPTHSPLDAAHSAPNVWGIGLNADYVDNSRAFLNSPVFDFSTVTVANLSFWQNRSCETTWDGVRIEWTANSADTTVLTGFPWRVLGTYRDANGKNWYNRDSLRSGTLNNTKRPAWDSISGGWVQSSYKLGTVAGICGSLTGIQFRFVFTSDPSVTDPGFLIDDFCIKIPPLNDVGIAAIVSPPGGSGLPAGTSVPLVVSVENFGQNPQTAFDIGYSINGVIQTPFSWSGSLPVSTVLNVTLPNITIPANAFTLCVWTELPADGDRTNDTNCIAAVGVPTLPLTYCDDFEGANVGWVSTSIGNQLSVWELGTPNFGVTAGANSGFSAWDINLNTAYGNNANAQLYTPYFDFSNVSNSRIQFSINYAAENGFDGTRLEFSNDQGLTWRMLGGGSLTAPDPCGTNWYNDASISSGFPAWTGASNGWLNCTYKLCCTTGILNNAIPVQFRFVFTSEGFGIDDGVSIDDFCIFAPSGDDIGVSSITSPKGGYPVGTSVPVTVKIENYGSTTVTSADVSYLVNGVVTTFNWSGSIPPCGSALVTLPDITIGQGANDVCAFTGLGTDVDHSNDTTCITAIGQPILVLDYTNNYFDNFDAGNIGWAPSLGTAGDPTTIWEFGNPNFGQTTFAHSQPTAWDINLNTTSNSNAFAILTSPYFDLTNANNARLSFWQNRSMDAFGDQFYLEYSINQSGVWQTFGTTTTPNATNWYNNANFWNDVTPGWSKSTIKNITALLGNPALIQFRFVYKTDAFSASEGVSVDDWEIYVPIPLSVSPTSVNLSNPNTLILPGQQIAFSGTIKNNGYNTVQNHNATLKIDGVVIATDFISYAPLGLASDSSRIHAFAGTWQATPGFHSVCVYTDTPNGSTDLTQYDDTICTTVLVFDSISTTAYPYCNDFENSLQWVTLNGISYAPKTTWEIGSPNQTHINSAHSGNKAWTTYLDSNYVNKDSSGLFSSLLRVQTGHCYKLGFWQEFRMEYGSDGGSVDMSKDLGKTWQRIDFAGSSGVITNGAPGTNYTYVASLDPTDPSQRGFTGVIDHWQNTEKVIRPDFDGQIIIRWRFASDYSARDEGWAIDDVCFTDLGICTPIGLNDFAIEDFGLSQNYPNPSNGNTTFEYMIPNAGKVKIVLTDMLGQVLDVIVSENQDAGKHTFNYNTSKFVAGIYTYTLTFEEQQITKRMIIAE